MTVFNVDTTQEDVELVLRDVGDAVRKWEAGDSPGLALSVSRCVDTDVLQRARQLRLQAAIDRNAIVHSTRPGIGPWIIRFQHLARRLTWWFTGPILQQVSAYQLNSALAIEGLAEGLQAIRSDLVSLKSVCSAEDLSVLEARTREIERTLTELVATRDA